MLGSISHITSSHLNLPIDFDPGTWHLNLGSILAYVELVEFAVRYRPPLDSELPDVNLTFRMFVVPPKFVLVEVCGLFGVNVVGLGVVVPECDGGWS